MSDPATITPAAPIRPPARAPLPPAPKPAVTAPPPAVLDLISACANAAPDSTIDLGASTYVIDRALQLHADRVTLRGDGARIVRAAGINGSSTIVIYGNGVIVSGITFDSDKPLAVHGPGKVGVTGILVRGQNARIDQCRAANVDTGIQVWPGAHNGTINGFATGPELRGDGIYNGGGIGWVGNDCDIRSSLNEHAVRIDADTPLKPSMILNRGRFGNEHGKEAIAQRQGSLDVNDATLETWCRAGQGPDHTEPNFGASNVWCPHVAYSRCTWAAPVKGFPQLAIMFGVRDGHVIGCTFPCDADQVPITINAESELEVSGNRTPGRSASKPLARLFGAALVTGSDAGLTAH